MNDQTRLKRMMDAREFAMTELALYLDTHPHDKKAMELRAVMQKEAEKLKQEYECRYGSLIVTHRDVSGDCWCWVDNPWPWDYQREA